MNQNQEENEELDLIVLAALYILQYFAIALMLYVCIEVINAHLVHQSQHSLYTFWLTSCNYCEGWLSTCIIAPVIMVLAARKMVLTQMSSPKDILSCFLLWSIVAMVGVYIGQYATNVNCQNLAIYMMMGSASYLYFAHLINIIEWPL